MIWYRRNPDDELSQLEETYALTGDPQILDRINILLTQMGKPLIFSQEQVLEKAWREVDSDFFQFINEVWSSYDVPDLIYAHLMRQQGLNPDDEDHAISPEAREIQNEIDGLREQWNELQDRRRKAFDRYLKFMLRGH